jgi:hypothetical protein
VLCAARDVRACRPRAGARLVLAMAVAALTPTGGLLATGLAAAVLGWPGPDRDVRTLGRQLAVAVLLNAPWWLPALLRPGGSTSDPAGVDAFAARAESWAGSLGSLLGLGGIWNAEAVPASRTLATAPLLTAVALLVAAAGWTPLLRASRSTAVPLTAVAGVGLLVGLAGSVATGRASLRWAVEHVAGAGLLRDGQRFVAPLALLLALCVGMAAERLLTRLAGHPAAASAVAALLLMLPVVGTPDLAWGVGGRLAPASYPPDWAAVRAQLAHAPEPGDVVVLPFGAFRAYGWNGGRTVLDPAPRAFGREVVVDDRLVVGGREVAGEDPRAAAVRHALDTGQPLGPLGIGWVVVEEGVPGAAPAAALAGAERRYAGRDLELHRLPGYAPATWPRPPVVPVVVADLAAATAVLAAAGLALPARRRKGGKPAVRGAPETSTGW